MLLFDFGFLLYYAPASDNLIASVNFTLDFANVTSSTSIMISSIMISLSGSCGLISLHENLGVSLGLLEHRFCPGWSHLPPYVVRGFLSYRLLHIYDCQVTI